MYKLKHHRILSRIRHLRGHGIHSPFVYRLARDVFTGCPRIGEERGVYDTLRSNGVRRSTARQLQNLLIHCGFRAVSTYPSIGGDACVVMPGRGVSAEMILENAATTFVIVSPYRDKARIDACLTIAAMDGRLTIDTRRFFIIFYDRQLPWQHFKL